ncbi:hypothetical protein FKM82_028881 [Ascaphus truei]
MSISSASSLASSSVFPHSASMQKPSARSNGTSTRAVLPVPKTPTPGRVFILVLRWLEGSGAKQPLLQVLQERKHCNYTAREVPLIPGSDTGSTWLPCLGALN